MNAYGLTKCSTCQKALGWFAEKNIVVNFFDVKENPVTPAQVAKWARAVGGWEKLINRAGYTWRGLPDEAKADLTDAGAVALALANPSLIRRPLIEHADGTVTVGFSEKVRAQF